MAEQLADDWQGLAKRQRTGSEAVTEIVQPNILQFRVGSNGLPDMVEAAAAEAPFTIFAWKHPPTALPSRQCFEQAHRRRRQLDRAGSGLGIGEVEFAGFKIDIRPAQGEYLALAAAGQHQQADRGHGDG